MPPRYREEDVSSSTSSSRATRHDYPSKTGRKKRRSPEYQKNDGSNNSDVSTGGSSLVKTSLVFLGSIAAATFCAHKYWPKGFMYGDPEPWEHHHHGHHGHHSHKKAIVVDEKDDGRRGRNNNREERRARYREGEGRWREERSRRHRTIQEGGQEDTSRERSSRHGRPPRSSSGRRHHHHHHHHHHRRRHSMSRDSDIESDSYGDDADDDNDRYSISNSSSHRAARRSGSHYRRHVSAEHPATPRTASGGYYPPAPQRYASNPESSGGMLAIDRSGSTAGSVYSAPSPAYRSREPSAERARVHARRMIDDDDLEDGDGEHPPDYLHPDQPTTRGGSRSRRGSVDERVSGSRNDPARRSRRRYHDDSD